MTVDLSPLYRTAIGFDRLASMLENANRLESAGYPPYNIEVTGDDEYQITMAVAGFTDDELSIESKQNELSVTGEKSESEAEQKFLHRGIATRSLSVSSSWQTMFMLKVHTSNMVCCTLNCIGNYPRL